MKTTKSFELMPNETWRVFEKTDEAFLSNNCKYSVLSSNHGLVCNIAGFGTIPKARSELIAAAPELMAFAQWAIAQFQGESGAGENYWEQHPEYKAGQAAIAKVLK